MDPEVKAPAEVVHSQLLVGVVHRDGQKACPENAHGIEFHALHWEVGFTPLVLEADLEARVEQLHGKVAVVRGSVSNTGPETEPIPEGYSPANCPIPQMRGDMIESPDGMRFDRGRSLGLAGFNVGSIEAFTGLTVEPDGEDVNVRLENTFDRDLTGKVEIVLHYMGCFGKPGSKVKSLVADAGLPMGEVLEGKVPAILPGDPDAPPRKGGNANEYALFMVEVVGGGEGLYLDFDAKLRELGAAPIECPDRK